jgi:hypothetical protein
MTSLSLSVRLVDVTSNYPDARKSGASC